MAIIVANSVALDSNSNIYVQSRFADGIRVYSSEGDYIKTLNLNTKHGWCVKIYDDVLYYGSQKGTIKRYDIKTGSDGVDLPVLWEEYKDVQDSDGRYTLPVGFTIFEDHIYIASTLRSEIVICDLDGKLVQRIDLLQIISSDFKPNRLAVDQDAIIVSSTEPECVALINRHDHADVIKLEKVGDDPDAFNVPWDVEFHGGHIYVTDLYNHRVHVMDRQLETCKILGGWGKELGRFNYVYGMAFNYDLAIFADTWNHGFQIWKRNGDDFRPHKSVMEEEKSYVLRPSRIKVVNGELVVTDYLNHCFKFLDKEDLSHRRSIGRLGFELGEFRYPTGFWWDGQSFFASDIRSGRLSKLSDDRWEELVAGHEGAPMAPDSQGFISYFENRDDSPVLQLVSDICLDRQGNIYVADIGQKVVVKLDSQGHYQGVIGKGLLEAENKTAFIACEEYGGNLYVTNPSKAAIEVFSLAGKHQKTITPIANGKSLNMPTGIAASENHIAIADRLNHRIVILDHAGGVIETYGQLGDGDNGLCAPWDVALDGETMYVADSLNNRIKKIALLGILKK